MAWERVGGGDLGGGHRYEIDRQVRYLPVPYTNSLPLRGRTYGLRLVDADGASTVLTTGGRSDVEATAADLRAGRTDPDRWR